MYVSRMAQAMRRDLKQGCKSTKYEVAPAARGISHLSCVRAVDSSALATYSSFEIGRFPGI